MIQMSGFHKSHHLSYVIAENLISIHELHILRMLKCLPETEIVNYERLTINKTTNIIHINAKYLLSQALKLHYFETTFFLPGPSFS